MLKIEFEGTDGAGKTTGLKYFIEQAKTKGLSVMETREVGNPNIPSCVKLREFVLDPKSNLSGEAMELIFSAMRFENDFWLKGLKYSSALPEPDLVVSDRGWFSHLAYTDHNVSKKFTDILYNSVLKEITLLPDVVIYFSVDTETALKRRVKRGETMDVIEMKGVEFQDKVRDSFEYYFNTQAGNFSSIRLFTIDANQSIENVKFQLDVILNNIVKRLASEESQVETGNSHLEYK
jgi:dTMP kinase